MVMPTRCGLPEITDLLVSAALPGLSLLLLSHYDRLTWVVPAHSVATRYWIMSVIVWRARLGCHSKCWVCLKTVCQPPTFHTHLICLADCLHRSCSSSLAPSSSAPFLLDSLSALAITKRLLTRTIFRRATSRAAVVQVVPTLELRLHDRRRWTLRRCVAAVWVGYADCWYTLGHVLFVRRKGRDSGRRGSASGCRESRISPRAAIREGVFVTDQSGW